MFDISSNENHLNSTLLKTTVRRYTTHWYRLTLTLTREFLKLYLKIFILNFTNIYIINNKII